MRLHVCQFESAVDRKCATPLFLGVTIRRVLVGGLIYPWPEYHLGIISMSINAHTHERLTTQRSLLVDIPSIFGFSLILPIYLASLISSSLAVSYDPGSIPLNWKTQYECAVDVPSHVITGVVTTVLSDNTVATCIELCDEQNYIYAGVENGNECHCGSGLAGTPQSAPVSDCNLACAGDSSLSCGGPWRVQSPALPSGGWGYAGCYVDTAASPAFAPPVVHKAFSTNVELFGNCLKYCQHVGMPWSGLENGEDCQCSFGLAPDAVGVDRSECAMICPGPFGLPEQCGGFERLIVWKNQ